MIMETLKNNKLVTMITLVVIILLLLTGGWKLVLGAVLMGGAIYYFGEEKVKKFFVDSYKKIASLFQTAAAEPENRSVVISTVTTGPWKNAMYILVVASGHVYFLPPKVDSGFIQIPKVLAEGKKATIKTKDNQTFLIVDGQEFEVVHVV